MDYTVLQKNFEERGFKTIYCENKAEATEYLKNSVNNTVVGIGGSMTAVELNLYHELRERNTVIWHFISTGMDTREACKNATVYILSANGVSQDGALVNIDGTGNRLAYSIFGPKRVIYIIGKNKIVPTLEDAIHRAKNIASPKNAQRLKRDTPCAKRADRCYDCNSPGRICNATLILDRAPSMTPSTILFVDEDLGF